MRYAYPIIIDENKKIIKYPVKITLSEYITLAKLSEYLGVDENFSISLNTKNCFSKVYEIEIIRTRLETDEERDTRVAQEKLYMENYNKNKRQ